MLANGCDQLAWKRREASGGDDMFYIAPCSVVVVQLPSKDMGEAGDKVGSPKPQKLDNGARYRLALTDTQVELRGPLSLQITDTTWLHNCFSDVSKILIGG